MEVGGVEQAIKRKRKGCEMGFDLYEFLELH